MTRQEIAKFIDSIPKDEMKEIAEQDLFSFTDFLRDLSIFNKELFIKQEKIQEKYIDQNFTKVKFEEDEQKTLDELNESFGQYLLTQYAAYKTNRVSS